jgi:hypothetical protein
MVFSLTKQNQFYQPNNVGNLISIGKVKAKALKGSQVGVLQPQLGSLSVVPLAGSTTTLANLVPATTSASYIPLTASVGATAVPGIYNNYTNTTDTVYFFDTPRAVSITLAVGSTTTTFTIWGFDQDDVFMTEKISVSASTTIFGKKAFAGVTRVWAGGATVGAISVGTTAIIGLPYVLNNVNRILGSGNFGAPTIIAPIPATGIGTSYTIADQTAPATAITGDIRGTVNLSAFTVNGINRLVVVWLMSASTNDVNQQNYRIVYGVPQYVVPYN